MSRIVVLSGPSAVGKSTVVRCLRDRVPDLHFSVSATTRAPRPGEVDGVDYSFVSAERFQRMIDDGALLEWAEIHRGLHRSGTPAAPVRPLPVMVFRCSSKWISPVRGQSKLPCQKRPRCS